MSHIKQVFECLLNNNFITSIPTGDAEYPVELKPKVLKSRQFLQNFSLIVKLLCGEEQRLRGKLLTQPPVLPDLHDVFPQLAQSLCISRKWDEMRRCVTRELSLRTEKGASFLLARDWLEKEDSNLFATHDVYNDGFVSVNDSKLAELALHSQELLIMVFNETVDASASLTDKK